MVRGVSQAALFMRDGMSLFDPWANLSWSNRTQPLENIKRIEVVTGPGGVLWGANSFLGIVNMITKDAEDVNGVEVSAGYGDGRGNKQDFRTYALFGKTFLAGKLKIFQHISYESDIGEVYTAPQFITSAPSPQPGGNAFYGQTQTIDPGRSWLVTIDGKYSYGPVSLYYMVPFGDQHSGIIFANALQGGTRNLWNLYDRYAILEYKDRFLKEKLGLTVKGYGTQFVRNFGDTLFPPSAFFPNQLRPDGSLIGRGGLNFSVSQFIFRAGTTADIDYDLPFNLRLLIGGEFFYEGVRDSTQRFNAPLDSTLLPLVCPVSGTQPLTTCPRVFAADTGRFVAAGYVDAQWRPFRKLTLDAGVRIQQGLRQSAVRAGAAGLGRHRLQLPSRLPLEAQLRDRLPRRRCSRIRRFRPAASTTAPIPSCRPRRRRPFRASSTPACCATSAKCASSSCAPTIRTPCSRTSFRSSVALTPTSASAPFTRSRATPSSI